ncbi:MAG: DUF5606 domain-containing protein [Bacteroidota bacterium]
MKLDDFVAVSGMSGIYRMVANRSNGLIVEDLDNGKKKFASTRKHQFTPLVSIGIYTDTDTTELKLIFQTMLDQLESNPPVSVKAPADEINIYFAKILPEYDRDRVYISDIKKVIKWFNFLHERNLLVSEEEETTEEEVANAEAPNETPSPEAVATEEEE